MWDVSVETLVHPEEPEKVLGGGVIGSGTALALPEGGSQVIPFGEDCSFTDVKRSRDSFEMEQSAGQF